MIDTPASLEQGPGNSRLADSLQRWATPVLWLTLIACVVRLWVMPMSSSFWVDEMGTAFVVHHGADHPSFAAAPQVPDSIYYAIPKLAESWFGFSEISYRAPSAVLMLAALLLIAWLAVRLIHPQAGWMAVLLCFALRGINYQAADARPYALGTLVGSACLYFLVRWLDEGRSWDGARWADAVGFIIAGALLWRVHLIFWPFYLVLALYTILRIARRETSVTWPRALLVLCALGVALIPAAVDALRILRSAGSHVIVELPGLGVLPRSLHLGMLAGFAAGGSLLAHFQGWKFKGWKLPASSTALIAGWWLCQPACLFAFSWISGNSAYVDRYLAVSLPGCVLASVALASAFLPDIAWRPITAVLGIGVLILMGQWTEGSISHHPSDWRGAAAAINALSLDPQMPVLAPSPFVEAQPPVWTPEYPLPGFLYSHLDVYRLTGKTYPFPFRTTPEAERYAEQLLQTTLAAQPRFVILGGDRNVWFWRDWFAERAELKGWRHRQLGLFGDVEAVVFEPSGP
jgi:hypothetical protein